MGPSLVIILDGLGDRPVAALGGRTPLEAAETPVMDRLAARGKCGLVDPLGPGVRVGTHVGAGVLMGLHPGDARKLGRGPVEAAGVGLELAPGDVAWRCNLATFEHLGGEQLVLDRRAGRCSVGNDELCAALDGIELEAGARVALRAATGHRAVLRLRGPGLSSAVTACDPGDSASLPAPVPASRAVDPDDAAARRTAAAVNELVRTSFEVLDGHPVNAERRRRDLPIANGIIARGPGQVAELGNAVSEAGLRAAVVSAECTVQGLARLFGFDVIDGPELTADTDTDLDSKFARGRAALAEHDVVYVHVKGTDLCAHDRRPDDKRAFIERIDAALAPLAEAEIPIAVTADHCTDSNIGAHTDDPVPTLMYWPGIEPGPALHFGETACRFGSLGRITATRFLARFLERDEMPLAGDEAGA